MEVRLFCFGSVVLVSVEVVRKVVSLSKLNLFKLFKAVLTFLQGSSILHWLNVGEKGGGEEQRIGG